MRKLLLSTCFIIFFGIVSLAQSDSCRLRISLLTCDPGEELYSTFGHTALRVTDSTTGGDYIFNYGTFQFNDDFYINFVKGKLLYYLSVENLDDFLAQYQWESRSVHEQELLLTCAEKQTLYTALQVNAQPENRFYLYDFLFDNCTTRARDIVANNLASPVTFHNILPEKIPTFRNEIHTYLDLGGQYWSKLGIDMLLGAKMDRKVTNLEVMFLPDNLLKGFDHATVNNHPLVAKAQTILTMPSPLNKGSLFRPSIVFTLLLVVVAALTWVRKKWAVVSLSAFDFLFFFILGLCGILMLVMWFATDHVLCQNNWNLLWALPTHSVVAFIIFKNKPWVTTYFKITMVTGILLLATWFILPQQMHLPLIPIVLLVVLRSWQLTKKYSYATKGNRISK